MSSVIERISSALSSLGKRRDRDGNSAADGTPPPSAGGSASRPPKRFRPWEQADLHRRLDSYSPLTWFAKPASVGPVPCALRGWVNEACDTLTCEHCGAKLVWPPNVPYDQRQAAADLFSPALTTKHSASCPWRQTHCNESLLVYQPSHSNDEMVDLFNSLHSKLLRVEVLPELDAIAIQAVRNAASPYGPYDQLVLGVPGRAAGAADGTTVGADLGSRKPQVTVTEVDENGKEVPNGGAVGDAASADGPTILLQPSKLTPQQKAKLLALLGWHVDVIQPDSASGTAAAPYAQSTTYSLQHLGIGGGKGGRQARAAGAEGTAGMAASAGGKYPMSQVVLRCPHCNGKMGLWNFAGVRPVPSGRLTPATSVGAAGIAGLRAPVSPAGAMGVGGWATPTKGTPLAGSGASFVGATIPMPPPASPIGGLLTAPPAAADPLAVTIAGGNYAAGGGTPLRPFGSAATSQPAFGGFGASQPVFGTAALDAEAAAKRAAGAAPSFADIAAAAAAAAASTAGVGAQNRTCVATPLQGQKRKAESEPEAMAVDGEEAGPGHGGKRARVYSGGAGASASAAKGSGPAAAAGTAAAAGGSDLKQLDPVAQHRSWCPWVFTGTGEQRHMNGWQHMLSALTSQQQQAVKAQQQQQAAGGKAAGTSPASPGSVPTSGVDARVLKDQVVANIRAL